MAVFEYREMFVLIPFTAIFIYLWKRTQTPKKTSTPTNWPVAGMLPAILQNIHQLHSYMTDILTEHGGTFQFKGVWFSNTDMLFTSDPNNLHHIFSKNFSNYPKGPEFRKIFEILGDGIFNADFQLWELHRRRTLSLMTDVRFYRLLEDSIVKKIETGLLPVLDHFAGRFIEFDLQDIFQRFTYDSICKLVLDHDPGSLTVWLPVMPSEKAFNDTVDALLHRHFLPEFVWKLQGWLGIGKEQRLVEAGQAFDEFIYPVVDSRMNSKEGGDGFNILTSFRKAYEETNGRNRPDKTRVFLRDTALNMMFAGRDTTSTALTWLFWLITTNPESLSKIRDEIERVLELNEGENFGAFGAEESRKLVYLHGALCESLRLYPPVALEHKAPIRPDILPSGDSLAPHSRVIVSFYSMGRMESLWGKDCLEFKPERWISARGGIQHVPSYKFPAFNAGPRTCLGRDMAFIQMKMVAVAIIHSYDIHLIEGHPVTPRDSVILQAEHGLRVRLSKR
ncbi:alkane hydroxylase MAH1-like [Andrographis paniculata]|uniref:alkane hydroxylase MAH1-like n=1 Tax=Andrographis paniculata TaxID=175694 RepID=UPI0021E956D8|nr:alkane hydroxylase MAH1-like [Andrographis paniculata]